MVWYGVEGYQQFFFRKFFYKEVREIDLNYGERQEKIKRGGKIMLNEVNNAQQSHKVHSKQQCNAGKRVAYTLCPIPSSIFTFTKSLAEGKNIYEAGNEVKTDIQEVHEANKKQIKERVKENAEFCDKNPFYMIFAGFGIKILNYVIN